MKHARRLRIDHDPNEATVARRKESGDKAAVLFPDGEHVMDLASEVADDLAVRTRDSLLKRTEVCPGRLENGAGAARNFHGDKPGYDKFIGQPVDGVAHHQSTDLHTMAAERLDAFANVKRQLAESNLAESNTFDTDDICARRNSFIIRKNFAEVRGLKTHVLGTREVSNQNSALIGDQFPVPSQKRLGRDIGGQFRQYISSEQPGFGCQAAALVVRMATENRAWG
jgi:hypothetical protein